MKTFKYFFAAIVFSAMTMACSDKDDDIYEPNPVEGLLKVHEFSEVDHTVEIYCEKPSLQVGYNQLYLRIYDKSAKEYVSGAQPAWQPMMHMETTMHSAPHSSLVPTESNSVYTGHIVFQMAGNETEYWELTLDYTFKGETVSSTHRISVVQPADGLKKSQVFTGSDGVRYILAMVNPKTPKVAINDFEAVLYRMENMESFPLVENFKIGVDPRMPSMGNHTSPNNQDMVYDAASKLYKGKLSFTMTGFWNINLKLFNADGELLKGEDVTEAHPESSLLFELEF